jgi:class 3 adenylate cyclase
MIRGVRELPSGTVTFLFTDIEVDTQGDAFFVAFGRAGDAVEAPIRVPIGVHTGEPLVTQEG